MKIFREIILTIIPSIAVILILVGIVLYNFNPTASSIPEVPEYFTSSEVDTVINQSNTEDKKEILKTYSVSQSQLNTYEQVNSYIPGKAHPFSTYSSISTDVDVNGDGVVDEKDEEEEEQLVEESESYSNASTSTNSK